MVLVALTMSLLAADPLLPANGAEDRQLRCGPALSPVAVSVTRFQAADGGVLLERLEGTLSAPGGKPPRGGPKPKPGCPFALPLPTDAWRLTSTGVWAQQASGGWLGPKGQRAALVCEPGKVDAAVAPSALTRREGKECPAENAFRFTGGSRQSIETVRCVLRWSGGSLALTFGAHAVVELVRSEDDCFTGSDWRAIPP